MPTILGIAILLIACTDPDVEAPTPGTDDSTTDTGTVPTGTSSTIQTPSVVIVDPAPTSVPADVEVLAEGSVSGMAAPDPFTLLYTSGVELRAVDAFGGASTWAESPGALTGAVPWGDGLLLAAGGALYDWDGVTARVSVLTELVGPAARLSSREGAVWIGADAGLRRWKEGTVVAVTVGDDEVGAYAVGGDVRGNDVVWVAQDDVLHGVGNAGAVWVDLEAVKLAGVIDSVAVGVDGVAWAAAGGWLYRRHPIDGWQRVDLGQPVWEVYGHADAVGVWIESDTTWFWSDGIEWQEVTGLPAPSAARPPGIDAAGRLLIRDASGLQRASTTRPLVVVGLDPGMVVGRPTAVTLLPTAPASVTSLTAQLVDPSGGEVLLDVVDGTVLVDPEGLAAGPWTFHAEAIYDGRVSTAEVPVFLGAAFEPTWTDDIEPIYQNACALCHDGAASTVLETPEDWERVIEEVIYNVEVGNMPLGGTPLPDVEVVIIEAWRDAGFPR